MAGTDTIQNQCLHGNRCLKNNAVAQRALELDKLAGLQ